MYSTGWMTLVVREWDFFVFLGDIVVIVVITIVHEYDWGLVSPNGR